MTCYLALIFYIIEEPMKIEIYSINNCGYCEAARALLKSKGLDFLEINITDDFDKRQALVEKTNHRTMPQIFIDDKFIGGYTELKEFFNR